MSHVTVADAPFRYEVLSDDGWLEWNSRTWRLKAERVAYGSDSSGASFTGVLYTDFRGRVRMPPLNPYLPFYFQGSGSDRPERLSRQWIDLAGQLADDLRKRQVVGRLALPPGLLDARPLQWAGMQTEVRYTYCSELPHHAGDATAAVRKQINKSLRAGYHFENASNLKEVLNCLNATEGRQGFSYRLTDERLTELVDLLGPEKCRAHLVRDSTGAAVSAGIRLVSPGAVALDWVQGSDSAAMKAGVVQLMYRGALDDIASVPASVFDYGGANLRTVAAAKAEWGMKLTPYIVFGEYDARHLYRTIRGALDRTKRSFRRD